MKMKNRQVLLQCLKTGIPSVNHGLPTPVQHLWLPEELVKKEAGVAFGLMENVMIRGQGGERWHTCQVQAPALAMGSCQGFFSLAEVASDTRSLYHQSLFLKFGPFL